MNGERRGQATIHIPLFVGVLSVLVTINLWILSDIKSSMSKQNFEIKNSMSEQSKELKSVAEDVNEFRAEIRLIKFRLDSMNSSLSNKRPTNQILD